MTGVPYPPNPPENPPHPFIPGSPGWLAYERGRAAADSWWRERLTSDETNQAIFDALLNAEWTGSDVVEPRPERARWRCGCELLHEPDQHECPWVTPELRTDAHRAPWRRTASEPRPGVKRITVRWRERGGQPGGYVVNVPNFDGGDLVAASDYDAAITAGQKLADALSDWLAWAATSSAVPEDDVAALAAWRSVSGSGERPEGAGDD